jgi:putative FmdB family regulatory protein
MPIYEYECANEDKIFEVQQKFADTPLTVCPDCGGSVKKIMSLTSFSLKGSGWYSTDYKKTTPKPSVSPTSGNSSTSVTEKSGLEKGAEKKDSGTSAPTQSATPTSAPSVAAPSSGSTSK